MLHRNHTPHPPFPYLEKHTKDWSQKDQSRHGSVLLSQIRVFLCSCDHQSDQRDSRRERNKSSVVVIIDLIKMRTNEGAAGYVRWEDEDGKANGTRGKNKSFGQLGGYPSREWELREKKKIKDRVRGGIMGGWVWYLPVTLRPGWRTTQSGLAAMHLVLPHWAHMGVLGQLAQK